MVQEESENNWLLLPIYTSSCTGGVSGNRYPTEFKCASLNRLLDGDFRVSIPPQPKRKFVSRIKVWKLRDPEKQAEISEVFKAKTQDSDLSQPSTVDVCWTSLKEKTLAHYKAGVWCFLESPMEKANMVVEQPGGGSSKGERQVF